MLSINFDPFPVLESERLLLRRLDENDALKVFELRSDSEAMKYVPRPLAKTIEEALLHITMINAKIDNNEGINWAITIKGNPDFIGIIGHYVIKSEHFRSEIGYMLLPKFQCKGIITEAINVVMEYGFNTMKVHSVEAIIDPENLASERVLQKAGFVKEAHLRENEFYDGKFLHTVIYSKLNPSK